MNIFVTQRELTKLIGSNQPELAPLYDQIMQTPIAPEKYTGYLINHAIDLTKLIKFIFQNGQLETSAIRESLLRVHASANKSDSNGLSDFTLTLFRHYVVNESGRCVEDMISFLKDCVLPILTEDEKKNFFEATLEQFLRQPEGHISQKAVI